MAMGRYRLAPGVEVDDALMEFTFQAGSGPGGQNVNKVATRCRLRVNVMAIEISGAARSRLVDLAGSRVTEQGDLLIECGESRSAVGNKEACVERLGELVRRAMVRPRVRRATRPTRGSKERRLKAKKERGQTKKRRRGEEA